VCELLGVSVVPAARLGVYFKEFRPRAEGNEEGWGIAWWEDGHPHVVKEPIRADESEIAATLAHDPPISDVFIVHVRAATIGHASVENTHPFTASALGREWGFAHNGTVKELDRLVTGAYEQTGDTDSELAFHHLLTRLERLGHAASDDEIAAGVLATGRELSEYDSRVNFLLSDGRTLFAYHDGHRTLHVVQKHAADLGEIPMADADYNLSLRLGDAPDERAVIVASVPLTDEPGWEKLDAGEFLVIRDGAITERATLRTSVQAATARTAPSPR
jgi:predicted glutamine amidotransferase